MSFHFQSNQSVTDFVFSNKDFIMIILNTPLTKTEMFSFNFRLQFLLHRHILNALLGMIWHWVNIFHADLSSILGMELEFIIPEKHLSREEKLLVWPSGSFPALPCFSGAGALPVSMYWAASSFCPNRCYCWSFTASVIVCLLFSFYFLLFYC